MANETTRAPSTDDHRILLVEDDEGVREALTDFLQDDGYEVVPAVNGAEAMNYLRSPSPLPCVILLDLMMPVMNGWEFRERQLQDARLAPIPVVSITAGLERLPPPGLAHSFAKPFDLDAFLGALHGLCAPSL